MRCIVINSCGDCPHRAHGGGFGNPAYKPRCLKKSRTLPYTIDDTSRMGRIAVQKDGIPSWCPLPKYTS